MMLNINGSSSGKCLRAPVPEKPYPRFRLLRVLLKSGLRSPSHSQYGLPAVQFGGGRLPGTSANAAPRPGIARTSCARLCRAGCRSFPRQRFRLVCRIATRRQTVSTSDNTCEENSTEWPRSAKPRTMSRSECWTNGSDPSVGSLVEQQEGRDRAALRRCSPIF